MTDFVSDMASAYSAATLVVSRAGAGTISELELIGKPAILVPSPNVAEDHQTKNAQALSSRGAAVLLPDAECRERLWPEIQDLISDDARLREMSTKVKALALPESDEKIVDTVVEILKVKS